MFVKRLAVVLCAVLLLGTNADAAKKRLPLLDKDGLQQGSASVVLAKGSAQAKLALAPLPARVETGDVAFEAVHYRAYLVSSIDPAAEISLGAVYPTSKGKAKFKTSLGGDVSGLGLDRLVVVAFSKDGLHSFDVLTAILETQ